MARFCNRSPMHVERQRCFGYREVTLPQQTARVAQSLGGVADGLRGRAARVLVALIQRNAAHGQERLKQLAQAIVDMLIEP